MINDGMYVNSNLAPTAREVGRYALHRKTLLTLWYMYEKQEYRVGLAPVLEHLQGASIAREEW